MLDLRPLGQLRYTRPGKHYREHGGCTRYGADDCKGAILYRIETPRAEAGFVDVCSLYCYRQWTAR